MENEPLVRCAVRYTGQVQGVGFRATARQVAAGLAVTGFVQNQEDGSVELVAEGERSELDRLLRGLDERMEGRIRNAAVRWQASRGEVTDFQVRR